MVVVRSSTTVVWMPWGITAARKGNWARMRLLVWMMLAPGWRKMMTVTEGDAVQVAAGANALRRVLHIGDVGKVHGQPIVVADHQRTCIRRLWRSGRW